MTHSPKHRAGWVCYQYQPAPQYPHCLTHLADTHTHTNTILQSLLHTHKLHTGPQDDTLTHGSQTHSVTTHIQPVHTITPINTRCHQLHTYVHICTKAYQYGRFSSRWGVQVSLTSQHNKTISPSLMKWLTQLTDECVWWWGGGGRENYREREGESADDVVTEFLDQYRLFVLFVLPAYRLFCCLMSEFCPWKSHKAKLLCFTD